MRKVALAKFVKEQTYTLKFGDRTVPAQYKGCMMYGRYDTARTTMGNLSIGEDVVFEAEGALLKFRKSHCPKGKGYVLSPVSTVNGRVVQEQDLVLAVYED